MITTQAALRAEFWHTHPQFKRQPGWEQNQYPINVRVAWCKFINHMHLDGQVSEALVERATL